jgi:hypothetical protein
LFCSNTINGIIAKFKCDQYFVVRTIIWGVELWC